MTHPMHTSQPVDFSGRLLASPLLTRLQQAIFLRAAELGFGRILQCEMPEKNLARNYQEVVSVVMDRGRKRSFRPGGRVWLPLEFCMLSAWVYNLPSTFALAIKSNTKSEAKN